MNNRKTLQEIIDWYIPPTLKGDWYADMMKEYARQCMEKLITRQHLVGDLVDDFDEITDSANMLIDTILNEQE